MANPWSHLKAAATGDLDAQRALADFAVETAASPDFDPFPVLLEGLIFARLAAAQSGEAADNGRVLSMLGVTAEIAAEQGHQDMHDELIAEGMARMSRLADRGDEVSAVALNELAADATPEGLAIVKAFEKCLADGGVL